ncbi:hypothetical protein DRE_00235 [Drechslerella stenobrocha 248]|uniref:ER membrane protein complex subunit 5 n=1 Tax=Drechslerella stenobrocha 248 TaxID=1043628 RepID=W7II02_9PEZI|nr:hypothetical protein DRE_00235 [Drechslerella stenobrocha 248]
MSRSLPSNILVAVSSVLLAHACYSAHEHSLLPATAPSLDGTPTASSSLPLDITLETLISVCLLLVGIVSSGWELKPISLRKYAGLLESGSIIPGGVDAETAAGKGRGLFDGLEERPGFLDIRHQRKEFADWLKHVNATS